MALFHKRDVCRGLTLFRWKQLLVELWICPAGYEIEMHSHPHLDAELIPVWGWCEFFRQPPPVERPNGWHVAPPESIACSPRRWFRKHTVPMGWVHWFKVATRSRLIFINIERWQAGHVPTSAAIDFQPT